VYDDSLKGKAFCEAFGNLGGSIASGLQDITANEACIACGACDICIGECMCLSIFCYTRNNSYVLYA
jgi:hypothetical protein